MELFDFKKNISVEDIKFLEKSFCIELPNDYKENILLLNGKSYIYTYILHSKLGELDFSGFISLNKEDEYNIYDIYGKVIESLRYFPFADTDFGDYYCFDLDKKKIVLWNHEMNKVIQICESFTKFLKMIQS